MKLNFIFVIALFFSITLVVAQPPFEELITAPQGLEVTITQIGTLKLNQTFTFNIHVFNNSNHGSQVTNATVNCTLHLSNSSGSQYLELKGVYQQGLLVTNEWRFSVLGDNFSSVGDYAGNIQCCSSSECGVESLGFDVTPSGFLLTTPNAILYGIIDFLIFSFLCLTLYFGIVLPFRNERNNLGKIVNINWFKYLKIFCWAMFYFLLVVFTWIAWNLIYAYSDWQSLGIIIKYFFFLELALALPIFLGIVIIGFINWITDMKIKENLSKFGESD